MLANLEADRARVADLDAQISHLERSLSALREEKMLAQERLDSYRYPVLTLPNEIVSKIFIHFLPAYPDYPPLTGLLSPTLLTHVCRTWQEIALGTPALWSTITSYISRIPLEKKVQIFDIWLARSRFFPLSLQIIAETDAAEILAAVVPHRARWEHLELSFLSSSRLPVIDGAMPLLRHLDLFLSDFSAVATEVFAFREVPLLRTVVLNDVAASSIVLSWAQLTSLTLLGVYPREYVPILQKTTNLVHCELEVCFDGDNDQPGPDIPLLCLESLTVDASSSPVTGFLETFNVPALRRLKISEGFIEPDPIESLTAFISKSGCKLEEAQIDGPRSLPKLCYRKAFPSIRKFSFDNEEESSDSDASDVEDNSE
ncbi:hypothetical protein B0H13DRAFT_1698519 [Mycena leptocephala]|nr:hypothetical protein B0H13DRAFT_1698519 [Mycena leptocephala]